MPEVASCVTRLFPKWQRIVQDGVPSAENEEFSELLQRAARGDSEAQHAICRQYERQVRIVARVLLGPQLRSHLDSTDVMQSVHHSLLMGIKYDRFDIASPAKLVALACTLARRKVARKWRLHRRQVRHGPPAGDSDYLCNTLSAIANRPIGPVEAAEFNDLLGRLCESMNVMERKMLEMRLDGYTNGEVAATLGIHPAAIRVRWTRLKQRLEAAGAVADGL